ncbi:MAG: sulfate ABC transporter ATP-binding protein [Candidatus Pacebacteria bacterium]|nr:sulfate ABC transporter ATP-binding protein [Candidatus Paceibacterota bacterium]
MTITVENLSRNFRNFKAVDNVSLTAEKGELLALLGPSGSGKTTLLRLIAGLEQPDSGSVIFEGEDVTRLDVRHRQVGFVFQHYGLFRHMTVTENIAFGLRIKNRRERPSKSQISERVQELLHLVQLDRLGQRHPDQLSGGQKQRVALARALAVEPRILLLDEPFGALDAGVRKDLRRWLRRLHDDLQLTTIVVTHDQDEAMELADRVVVMNRAKIIQAATPAKIYDQPNDPFVFRFLGAGSAVPLLFNTLGHWRSPKMALGGEVMAMLDRSERARQAAEAGDQQLDLFVRSHQFEMMADSKGDWRIRFAALTGRSIRFEVQYIGNIGNIGSIASQEPPSLNPGAPTPDALTYEVDLSREEAEENGLSLGTRVTLTVKSGLLFPR